MDGGRILEQLEQDAARVDALGNVEARGLVYVYLRLAAAYRAARRPADARAVLRRALRLDSWDLVAQEQLLELELELGDVSEARRRAELIVHQLGAPQPREVRVVERAREVLASTDGGEVAPLPRLALDQLRIVIVAFAGSDPALIDTVSSRLRKHLGIQIEVVAGPPPTRAGARAFSCSADREQLDATELIKQVLAWAPAALASARTVGALAITDEDIGTKGTNFLFGSAQPGRCAVISYARFEDPSPEVRARRTVLQALASAGHLLGVPRCTMPSCARAYPHSIVEHDRKREALCPECLGHFAARGRHWRAVGLLARASRLRVVLRVEAVALRRYPDLEGRLRQLGARLERGFLRGRRWLGRVR